MEKTTKLGIILFVVVFFLILIFNEPMKRKLINTDSSVYEIRNKIDFLLVDMVASKKIRKTTTKIKGNTIIIEVDIRNNK